MSPRKYGEGKTPIRSIRIEPELWDRFKTAAAVAGAPDVTSVLHGFIRWYVHDREKNRPVAMPRRPPAGALESPAIENEVGNADVKNAGIEPPE